MSIQSQIDQMPLNKGVKVIVSNEDGLLALEKPVGLLSHPNTEEDNKRSLLRATYDYEEEVFIWKNKAGEEQRAWLINRLDSPTSGVILLGLNEEIAQLIKQCFIAQRVHKTYFALIRKTPSRLSGDWKDVLKNNVKAGQRVVKNVRAVIAKTHYEVTETAVGGFPICLVRLMPVTGRTHQLRVQCKQHGHPIVGDRTYGSFSFNREIVQETGQRRMMLHSGETAVRYAYKGQIRDFKAVSELPEAFNEMMRFRPGVNHGRSQPGPRPKPQPVKRQLVKRPTSAALAQRRFKH